MGALHIGSDEHKRLFCRTFIDTHEGYTPADIQWPEIDADSRARLLALPIWDEAVHTERETARKVQRMATVEPDPLVQEAIALQGFEEGRHAALLDLLTRHYQIPVMPRPESPEPIDPTWEFTRIEYGECFDAFFAFGLFAVARDSGFFPGSLVQFFDPVMQEEARHVLFFVNWIAYRRARLRVWQRPALDLRRFVALTLQIVGRVRTAFDLGGGTAQDNFAMNSHGAIGEFSVRDFLSVCLRENERRLGRYDPALLRPRFAPRVARAALKIMRG